MGTLRIIAGEHRGRRIAVPDGVRVRPTADRVREALFSILGAAVTGARVLDAYAGSGALGFEALSRGARAATFLESDRRAWLALRASAAALGVLERCTLLRGRSVELIARSAVRGPFQLILADPPYAAGEAAAFLPPAARLLDPEGLIVLERDARITPPGPPPAGLELDRTARYGRCCLDFFRRSGRSEAG